MYPNGWIKAVFTYHCKWCEREEVVTVTDLEGYNLEHWVMNGATGGLDICSTDCQKERDACIQQTFANLEPSPEWDCQPKGFDKEFERLRYEALKVRGLSHRVAQLKLF